MNSILFSSCFSKICLNESAKQHFKFCYFQVRFLRDYCTGYARSKLSITSEQLIDFAEKFLEFDAILTPVTPSTPWVSDDQSYWLLNQDM